MNKIVSTALLLVIGWQVSAQTDEMSILKRHELKLDIGYLLTGTLKGEYEYLLNDWSSVGASAIYNNSDAEFKAQVVGTYRLYFDTQPVSGFFLEGNAGVIVADEYWYGSNNLMVGAGIALGWKYYIPQPSIVLDLFLGVGRLFGNEGTYPRVGICIGKRF